MIFSKKELAARNEDKRRWIDPQHSQLSIQQQCELLGLARSSYYYSPRPECIVNLELLRRLDELFMECPFFGARRVAVTLGVSRGRAHRLMRLAGIEALYPKPRLSRANIAHRIYPYLLRDLVVERPDQVWCADITYIPMRRGFLYLVAVMDWFSRFVLAWELSSTLDTGFCLTALNRALEHARPVLFNTDQGAQFTSTEFTSALADRQILISMDGRGRWMDNVFIERLWRSLKYELIYPGDFIDGHQLWTALDGYFTFYNLRRPHQSFGYRTPAAVYRPEILVRRPIL